MDTKICTKCKKELPYNDEYFCKDKRSKSGLISQCKDCKKQYKKQYEKSHPEIKRKERKKYKQKYPEKIRKAKQKSKLQKRNNGGSYTQEQWKECKDFFDNKCAYTGEILNGKNINAEHIIPTSKGGTNYIWNICPSVDYANFNKYNFDLEEWYRRQPYFSEERLHKIYEWIEYAKNKYSKIKEAI